MARLTNKIEGKKFVAEFCIYGKDNYATVDFESQSLAINGDPQFATFNASPDELEYLASAFLSAAIEARCGTDKFQGQE